MIPLANSTRCPTRFDISFWHRVICQASRCSSGVYSAGKIRTAVAPWGPKRWSIAPPRLLASDAIIFVPFPGRVLGLLVPLSVTRHSMIGGRREKFHAYHASIVTKSVAC